MAIIYPKYVDPKTKSPAEKLLFEKFSKLSDDWVVFHHVGWIASNHNGRMRDGETDFVVAHRDLGILVIEVKGGKIKFYNDTHHFISIDVNGFEYDIGDPFYAAKDAMHTLLTLLKDHYKWHYQNVNFGYAVAFPDSHLVDDMLRLYAPRDIVIDSRNINKLENKLRKVLAYWGQKDYGVHPPDQSDINTLISVLGESGKIRNPLLRDQSAQEASVIHELTKQQFRVLSGLARYRKAIIEGCAGSGKTVLAIEKARRLLENHGYRVLFLCYNKEIAKYIRKRHSFEVFTFHELCEDLSKKANIKVDYEDQVAKVDPTYKDDYYDRRLPDALLDAINKLGPLYDAIIVDEAQDFRQEYWDSIPWLLKPDYDRGVLYIFIDEYQRIFPDTKQTNLPFKDPCYKLVENVRNTKSVFQLMNNFYHEQDDVNCLGPRGRSVDIQRYSTDDQMFDLLLKSLQLYCKKEKMNKQNIILLTPRHTSKISSLPGPGSTLIDRQLGTYKLVRDFSVGKMEVKYSSIYRYKGMESLTVIICEIDEQISDEQLEKLLYAGISRAKTNLTILYKDTASKNVQNLLSSKG